MKARYDAVIVGGGHNGLVCACYLAAAGMSVGVFERRHVLGGAAVTEEFHPGFRNSTASYTVSLLNPKVIRDLHLAEHGLRIVERPVANFLPLPDGGHLIVGGGIAATQTQVARFSRKDAEALPAYYAMLERIASAMRGLLLETPPNVGGGIHEMLQAWKIGGRLKRLTLCERRDLLDLFTKSAGDILDRWFDSDPVKAAFGFDSIVGNFASPYTPGSAYVLLHHMIGEVNGKRGQWGHAMGGMGSITAAMAAEARVRGVELFSDAAVTRVLVRDGRATGVALANGREVLAGRVIGNVNPKLLYLQLVDRAALDSDFIERIEGYRCVSGTFRMNVALDTLPSFSCLPQEGPHLKSGIIIGPSLAYMERAYFDARVSGWSREPIVELLIPSTVDASLAPAGKHVASLFCQHANPHLPANQSWDQVSEKVADLMIATVVRFAPDFASSIVARKTLSPLDLEREFGLSGGDIFHGALSLDQLFSARPVLGHGNYRGPIDGLYMCGAGTHPGGGVTGAPGHNAAREILRDARRWGQSRISRRSP
ncbi:MAG: NAD(P)/FAD-dependent oxidoreductase [Betaproteobacteria bacterium]|nr:MAG: NAD(P)/FAD-dependent oxidoreductase [Betaproteobacteria bacterium]